MSVRSRTRLDGTEYWQVRFREDGRESSISWNEAADAYRCDELIKSVGAARAKEIMRIIDSPRQSDTLAAYLDSYIDGLTGVDAATPKRYRAYLRNDLGDLGKIPLTALASADIAAWVAGMESAGASGKTIANKHGFLAGALAAAVKAGKLGANPCDSTRLPRWDRQEMVFLTRDEFAVLYEAVPAYWQPLVAFLVASGCRWSEATALTPKMVDTAAGTVRITKAWKTGTGGYRLGVPKTKMSVRTINVPADVLAALDLSGKWVFTNSGVGRGHFKAGTADDDSVVRIHSFHPNVWVPAVDRARAEGLAKKPRIHDLRHTCASWLIQAGRPLPAIQQHLGHESITTTVGTYGHLDRSSGQGNADVIARALARLG